MIRGRCSRQPGQARLGCQRQGTGEVEERSLRKTSKLLILLYLNQVLTPSRAGSNPSTPRYVLKARSAPGQNCTAPLKLSKNEASPENMSLSGSDPLALFAGNANPALAHDVAKHLGTPLGRAYGRFSDGEVNVELMENVRGRDVFILQSTCPPANDNLMELLVMVDACRRSSVGASITAVIPYMGYARQDRRRARHAHVRSPRSSLRTCCRAPASTRLLTIDLHAEQISGFFDIPVDNVYASPVLLGDAWRQALQEHDRRLAGRRRCGACPRAREAARRCGPRHHRQAPSARQTKSKVMNIIGEVEGKTCVLIDDMVDTAGTLCQAARGAEGRRRGEGGGLHHAPGAVRQRRGKDFEVGARRADRDGHDPAVGGRKGLHAHPPAVGAGLLAETIRRIRDEESVSSLYLD